MTEKAVLKKKKVCLLGAFAVGKTSLVERYVYSRFDEKYLTTMGVKVSQKILPPIQHSGTDRSVQFNFLIWDIAGMEKFDSVVMNYYRGASGALAVADLTRPETLKGLTEICSNFCSICPDARLLVLGNKLDIFQQNSDTISLLKETASDLSAEHLLTSAKTGEKVEDAFMLLAQKLSHRK